MTLACFEREVATIASTLQHRAKRVVLYGTEGKEEQAQIKRCFMLHRGTATCVLFTHDAGMHTSGWMRNPDYERCFHLSLSPAPVEPETLASQEEIEALWVRAFFGDARRWTWMEGPKSTEGRREGVRHWRLFCNPDWGPLMPRGEVYSATHTPPDWRSWTEVHALDGGPIIESTVDPS